MNSLVQNAKICSTCGAAIPARAPEGICIRCLLDSAIVPESDSAIPSPPLDTASADSSAPRYFGDYEILEQIGRGGMGIVYKARQFGTQRLVALKLLASGALATRDAIHRFHLEARAAASLSHPGIIPIYECGSHEGHHFLAMPYIEGGSLLDLIHRSPVNPRHAAEMVKTIAGAIAYAHQRGILHRDLKPGNILIAENGHAIVTDFGLARLQHDDAAALTLSGALLGTVSYMAPEQATGAATTTASDIYSLGAILYELLTGRLPFHEATIPATLRAIVENAPAPLSNYKFSIFNSQLPIPPDLSTICLKCLEKDPARRYPTAQALADDLQRFLNNEPIAARPIPRTAKLIRWSQRNPALAIAYSLLLLLLLVLLLGSPLAIYRINEARRAAEASLYASDMLLTQTALNENDLGRGVELLQKHTPKQKRAEDLRGWEWRYYQTLAKSDYSFVLGTHPDVVTAVGILPDSQTVWSAGLDKAVRFWNLTSRTQIAQLDHDRRICAAAQSADGRWLATVTENTNNRSGPSQLIRLWDVARRELVAVVATNVWPKPFLQFSPDARLLAHEDQLNGIHLLNLSTRKEVALLPARWNKTDPVGFAFSPDNRTLAYCPGRSGEIILWDILTGTTNAVFIGHTDLAMALAFSPDGTRLASGGLDRTLRIWDITGLKEALVLTNMEKDLFRLVFSPDSRSLAVADRTSQQVTLRNVETGAVERRLGGHVGIIHGVAFSPDGRTLITGGDSTVRVSDRVERETPNDSLKLPAGIHLTDHTGHAYSLSPDGEHLITVFSNATFRTWSTPTLSQLDSGPLPGPNFLTEALGPGGHLAAFAFRTPAEGLSIVVYDIRSRTTLFSKASNRPWVSRIRFSHDGRFIAYGIDPDFFVIDSLSGKEIHRFICRRTDAVESIGGISFSTNDRWVSAVTHAGSIYVWDLARGSVKGIYHPKDTVLKAASFFDNILLASGWDDVFLYDLNQGVKLPDFSPKPALGISCAISPDGKTLALAEDDLITLWSRTSRQLVGKLPGHRQEIRELAFTADGQLLVSVSFDQLRLWRAASFSEL